MITNTAMQFGQEEYKALFLSTIAGLSTTIGGLLAIIRRPDDGLLAFLLGVAIGVMTSLSLVELWFRNAMQHGFGVISLSMLGGGLLYKMIQPFIPEANTDIKFKDKDNGKYDKDDHCAVNGAIELPKRSSLLLKSTEKSSSEETQPLNLPNPSSTSTTTLPLQQQPQQISRHSSIPPSELIRLSFVMIITMTLHNLPEGFAVAFSSYTELGLIMTMAIAVHNIPEGVIVAAPLYAATGSRSRALGYAMLSGLSEPVGALIALLFVRPFLTQEYLHYMLSFVGGIMTAVCVLELLPEARKCKSDVKLAQGIGVGVGIMLWTLYMGV